jgi:hypothetical protein
MAIRGHAYSFNKGDQHKGKLIHMIEATAAYDSKSYCNRASFDEVLARDGQEIPIGRESSAIWEILSI